MKPTLSPYLGFNGNAKDAMEFYQSVLGGKLDMQTFGESGMPVEEDEKNKIIHAALTNDALSFMASDAPHNKKMTIGDNISMSIVGDNAEQLKKYFTGLSDGGTVDMPLEKQFWGDTFGMLTDKFGVHWMVNINKA